MKRYIDADEALRMMQNSKKDNPCSSPSHASVWGSAHDCCISCVDAVPAADVAPIADTVRAFADRLITYYNSLKGTTSPALTAYHVEQVLKDFIKEKEPT